MFIYCFDEQEKNKLQKQLNLKLYKESNIDNKQCWIFLIDNNKFNFKSIDKSKCIVSNKMTF